MSDLNGLIARGLARINEAHISNLGCVLEAALLVIQPNERRSGHESLDIFTSKSFEALDAYLLSTQSFVLSTINRTQTALTPVKVNEIVRLVGNALPEELYLVRFQVYESAFARRVARYGISMMLSDFGSDLSKASLQAGTKNRMRAFVTELKDALLTELERQRNTSPFEKKELQNRGYRQMSYSASVFNVMIASPSDVATERKIVRDVLYEWNAINAALRNVVLLPVGWETHSSPEMGAPPQTIINRQVLSKCDLLVGVFGTRIGTSTGSYPSGTVEEIEKHIEAGKPTMLYFSQQPIDRNMLNVDQYQRLKEFEVSCQNRGLLERYQSHDEFKDKFNRHLYLTVNEHPFFQAASISDDESARVKSKIEWPLLSPEASVLLNEASQDSGGMIIHAKYLSGTTIQANKKNFIPSNQRHDVAKWEAALEELKSKNLVMTSSAKGEVYEITPLGYEVADSISL